MSQIFTGSIDTARFSGEEPELLHQLFERQVRLRPEHPAIECRGIIWTYAELDRRADQIAMMLHHRGIGPGSLVALYSEKSAHLFAAMLGILKAGAGYVPIDPGFPIARVQSILSDAEIAIVLSDGALARDLAPHVAAAVMSIAAQLAEPFESSPPLVPVAIAPQDACYVIYTSGSTGTPKGVVIEHHNAVNFAGSLRTVYGLTAQDRVYQGFSIAFDASVEEIWAAFSLGATLVVPSGDIARSTFDAADFIKANNITYFSTVPSFLSMIDAELPAVRLLVLGGEACPPGLVERWATSGRRMLNTYGPTEATVVATAADCVPGEPVTIGKALPGYETFVLDENLEPVAPGSAGELYIGGDSIARGYLNRPELTAERFISMPPSLDGAGRLYRTFDLVRVGETGDLHFIGRADSQIKIRGFRVELSEIEAVLIEHPSIRAAGVSVVELGALKELAAYVVLEPGTHDLAGDSVVKLLRDRLPEYMVPRYLDVVQDLPAMTSGKIDRSRLPAPKDLLMATDENVVAPTTEVEKIIIAALEREFQLSPISIDADFFVGLRGHSLNAARVVTALRAELGVREVSVPDLYTHRTARLLAQHLQTLGVTGATAAAGGSSAPDEAAERLPPLPWFRYPCALLQLVSLLAFYGVVSSPLVLTIILAIQVQQGRLDLMGALDIGTTISFLIWPSWLALSIAVKWIVIGRYKPGRYRVWGFYYFRWWLVSRFQGLSWCEIFAGTPLMSLYFRAMGAKVGKNCAIGTPLCTTFDLVSIGDNSSIGSDTHLLGYRVENGWLILGNIAIGSDCYVGTHSCLGLDTVMGDRARLGDMSNLQDNAVIAEDQAMSGSPAQAAEVRLDDLQRPVKSRRGMSFLFGVIHLVLIYAMGYLLIASMLPGAALIGGSLYFLGPVAAAAAVFAAAPITMIWYLMLVFVVKWVAIGRILPGVYDMHSRDYLRYWFLNYLLNNTRDIAMSLYATLMLPRFLRMLGAKIGRGVEISTAMHIMPDLLEIGEGSFLADACIVGGHKTYHGRIELARNCIGKRSFVGNSAFVPSGVDIGDNSLIGVMSTPPLGEMRTGDGTRWLGSPGFELPNTESINCFDAKRTFNPGFVLVSSRIFVECMRLLLPGIVAAGDVVLFCMAVAVGYRSLSLTAFAFFVPAVALVLSILSVAIVALFKIALIDRFAPSVNPLWCGFVWLNEVVNALYESVAATAMAPLMGTPFISSCLRMMGCSVGKWAFIETTLFSEFDLVEIGDRVSLNLGATIQTHLFEDRVMKSDRLIIGDGCTVGNMSVVLYATEMKKGSSLCSLSVLMKGEVLPESSRWIGIPTRPVQALSSAASRAAPAAATASRGEADTSTRQRRTPRTAEAGSASRREIVSAVRARATRFGADSDVRQGARP